MIQNDPQELSERSCGDTDTAPAARKKQKSGLTVREMTVFAMLGALMFCSKLILEWAPNIHLLAPMLIAFTVVYRAKALIPLYIFVLLLGLFNGFNAWWVPYLYIWLPLFLGAWALPRRVPVKVAVPLYMLLGALHGALYGILYAPAQALFFHMDFDMTAAWIVSGLPFDLLHAIGNLAACTLTLPLIKLLQRLEKRAHK